MPRPLGRIDARTASAQLADSLQLTFFCHARRMTQIVIHGAFCNKRQRLTFLSCLYRIKLCISRSLSALKAFNVYG